MKKMKTMKKIELRRETLQVLTHELSSVVGGLSRDLGCATLNQECANTNTCPKTK